MMLARTPCSRRENTEGKSKYKGGSIVGRNNTIQYTKRRTPMRLTRF
jgi:hypothetical protein